MKGRIVLLTLALAGCATPLAAQTLVLDESVQFRRYYRFATDRVSPAGMRAEGVPIKSGLDAATLIRVRKDAEARLDRSGNDGFGVFRPSGACLVEARRVGTSAALNARPAAPADWRDYVFLRMFFDPYTAPPVPKDWTAPAFDDSEWVLDRGAFQPGLLNDLPPARYEGNMKDVHVGVLQFLGTAMHSMFFRTRFVVDDPAKATDLTLRVVYRGGVRVFVNGKEVARGHLPKGAIGPETPGDDYSVEAYNDESKRDRSLGPVNVPASLLVRGANVLAVEVRASDLHPVVLARPQSRSWNALHDREGQWRHGVLAKLELRGAGCESAMTRPAGVQVWTADIHHRVASGEFRMPGEGVGTVRIVGARNGTCSAQVVVGTDRDLAGLKVTAGALRQTGPAAEIPASAIRVLYGVPVPETELSDKLGDERGLDPSFPTAKELADFAAMRRPGPYVFDQLTPNAPARVPADTARPVWLSVKVPKAAAPGKYNGVLSIAADGIEPVSVPVEVEVVGWTLPDPKDFRTFVACEQNPYGVAKFYGVPLWSKEHFRLMEPSFREMGRLGSTWLNVPVLARTEFGNRDDSPVKWIRRKDGSLAWDYTALDRYLDLTVKHWGKPRVVMFHVMHGHPLKHMGTPPSVTVLDERTGKTESMPVGEPSVGTAEKRKIWEAFGKSLYAHMKSKGLEKSMHFGCGGDYEPDPELVRILGDLLPQVKWVGAPHQIGKGGYPDPGYYDAWGTVRYFDNWPGFRMDRGWKARYAHLTIPRIDSSVLSLCTASRPFAFRTLTAHSLALGRAGFWRVGADEWSCIHYDGMRIPTWIVGMPVLFTLWPGEDGAETSARHEALLEGIQEGEARVAIEQALDRGSAPKRLQAVLDEHFRQTSFFQNKLCIFELERYYFGWQERSRALYRAAAEAGR